MDEVMEFAITALKIFYVMSVILIIIQLLRQESARGNWLFAIVILLLLLGLGYFYFESSREGGLLRGIFGKIKYPRKSEEDRDDPADTGDPV